MKPTAYKIGEWERKWLSKDMQEVILAYEEEIRNLKSELSKFRDSFKKYRDYEKEELAESCYDLARENQKLKEEVRGLRDTKYTHWEPTVSSWGVWGQIYIL